MAETTIKRGSDDAGGSRLTIRGPLTIAEAARFKDALLEALGAGDEVSLDIQEVTALDLSALQLICAAHGSAETAGKRFAVAPDASEVYRKVADEAGFQCHVGCQHNRKSCIWTGGKC